MKPVNLHFMRGSFLILFSLSLFLFPSPTKAYVEIAHETGKGCKTCHRSPAGGPDLTPYGEAFQRGGYQYRVADEALRAVLWYQRIVPLVIGYLHVGAGVVWFGTIFYVHIIIKPERLVKGLPRSELILGWTCISVAGLTGALLSIYRINSLSQLYTTRFGIILSVKTVLFLLMVGIAMTTSLVIQKKLKMKAERQAGRKAHAREFFSHTELLTFDGTG